MRALFAGSQDKAAQCHQPGIKIDFSFPRYPEVVFHMSRLDFDTPKPGGVHELGKRYEVTFDRGAHFLIIVMCEVECQFRRNVVDGAIFALQEGMQFLFPVKMTDENRYDEFFRVRKLGQRQSVTKNVRICCIITDYMDSEASWQDKLEEALNKSRDWLESDMIPELRKHCAIYQTAFESIYNILIKKSIVKEDPYKYEEQITEVSPPPASDIMESTKQEQVSQRLSLFHTHLDFLNTYYQFSLVFLEMDRLKRIAALLSYFSWSNLAASSANDTSRHLNDLVQKVKLGTDRISSQVLVDSPSSPVFQKQPVILQAERCSSAARLTVYAGCLGSLVLFSNVRPNHSHAPDVAWVGPRRRE